MAQLIALTGQIEDDRAVRHRLRPVSVKDRVSFRITGRSFDLVEQEDQADPAQLAVLIGRRVLREQQPRRAERIAIWAVVLVGFVVVGAVTIIVGTQTQSYGPVIATIGIGLLMLAVRARDRQRARQDRVTLASLPPACMACSFDLLGVPTAEDGCTVCPECGAAWKLGDQPPPQGPTREGSRSGTSTEGE